MIKKLRMVSLGTLLSLSVVMMSSTAFAQPVNNSKGQQDITNRVDIRPFKESYDLNVDISKDTKTGDFTSTYKYAKAFYQNDAGVKTTVYIQSTNGNTTYDTFTVDANSSKRSDKTMTLSAGTEYSYNVTISGGATSPKGNLIIKSASTTGELD